MNSHEVNVLLVDDVPANLDVLSKTLRVEGYNISVALNGKMALKIAKHDLPDLILLDVMMPEMDGFETCEQLKSQDKTQDIPVIFLTAKTDIQDVLKGFSVGGVDYITKPFQQEEVRIRVRTQLTLRYTHRMLEQKNTELQAMNDLKNKFIGMAVHDMRTPLGGIIGITDLLNPENGLLNTQRLEKFLPMISQSAQTLVELIDGILDITTLENSKLSLKREKASLSETLLDRITIHSLIARKKDIIIKQDIPDSGQNYFDRGKLAQVIDNLLSNAIKFSPWESTITVKLQNDNSVHIVSISDEGPGLTETEQHKIFDAFQKLNIQPTAGEKSTGLGLAIVKKIITAHKGKIMVTSSKGKGATFSFVLPQINQSSEA